MTGKESTYKRKFRNCRVCNKKENDILLLTKHVAPECVDKCPNIMRVINPFNLSTFKEILFAQGRAIALPKNADIIFFDDSRAIPHLYLNGYEYKLCGRCEEIKKLSEFRGSKVTKDKLYLWCRDCVRRYAKIRNGSIPNRGIRQFL